ncbi:MAG: HD-GYP domain-containing protein [Oscillospiraceae bacterium]|nr:HD-GYP domain-containing protein [Oscillospiraceae bacterium]
MSELENSRQHIRRGGKILYSACRIGQFVLLVLIIAQAGLSAAVVFSPQAASMIAPLLSDNFLFNLLKAAAGLEHMEPNHQALIGCGVVLISYITIYLMMRLFSGMMKYLAEGEKPFDVKSARKLRHNSFWLLLFIAYNPLLGIISFSLMILFSYLMEYGGFIQQRADETNRIQEEMIMSFAEITENKSGQTGQHIRRVSEYSGILAGQLGLDPERVESIRIASTMHDVGKLLIPPEILEKPGRLTDEEFAIIKTHTTMGGKLLENVEGEEMQLSRTIALEHHERPDGRGYPKGLNGETISLEGRIVAVADVYDALTSRRSYKNAWKEEDAYQEILKGRGTQFDAEVVDAFVAAHDRILEVMEKYRD